MSRQIKEQPSGSGLAPVWLPLTRQVTTLLLLASLLARAQVACEYYVRLSKLGPIRGALMSGDGQQQQEQQQEAVVGFLNIGYAAPPTGPLRLMPPGAAHSGQGGPIERARILMPGGQRSPVRGHAQFGSRCVHLADWLEDAVSSSSASDNNHNNDGARQQQNDTQIDRASLMINKERALRRLQQSEDCLNLNVFVPINDSESLRQQSLSNNNKHQQQMKSNVTTWQRKRQWLTSGRSSPAALMVAKATNVTESGIREGEESGVLVATNRSDKRRYQDNEESLVNQVDNIPLWPLPTNQNNNNNNNNSSHLYKLPVLVLMHGAKTSHLANTYRHLPLARRAQCILITFNYRFGLLGFLPYLDRGADGKSALPRNNYAIWDHIGLLHWIKHNVAAFNGNPNNVILMAADNQASTLIQLLSMSSLTKGLFNRAIIVHDESRAPQEAYLNHLDQLLKMAAKARDLRRLLEVTLSQIVQTVSTSTVGHNTPEQPAAFDYIQSAPLEKLAQIDLELRRQIGNSNEQLLHLANGPNLDDRLLFPHLSALIKAGQVDFGHRSLANFSQVRSGANYCLYVNQLYANGSDPLGLVGSESTERGSKSISDNNLRSNRFLLGAFKGLPDWHRDPTWLSSKSAQPRTGGPNRASIYKRSVLATQFNHLHHVQMLDTLLNAFNRDDDLASSENQIISRDVHLGEADDEESFIRVQQQARNALAMGDSANQARKRSLMLLQSETDTTDKVKNEGASGMVETGEISRRSLQNFGRSQNEDRDQLLAPLGSIGLMIGYFKLNSSSAGSHNIENSGLPYRVGANYKNIADALVEVTGSNENLLALARYAELHFIASMSSEDSISHLCDFFAAREAKPIAKSSFLFLVENTQVQINQSSESDDLWLSNTADSNDPITNGIANFIKFGRPSVAQPTATTIPLSNETPAGESWPAYEPLNHRLKRFVMVAGEAGAQAKGEDSIDSIKLKNQIQVHLDVLPYLNSIDWSQQYQHGNSSHSSERIDLLACLNEIDSAINRTQTSKGRQRLFSTHHLDDLTWRCLISSALRIRAHLRQYAADDLERLNRLLRQQQINNSNKNNGNNSNNNNNNNYNSSQSSISTRNLVDDGVPIVDTLDNQRQLSSESAGQEANSNQDGPASIISQIPANTNAGIKGFFAGAYKDAVGKALTIVVGTGLSIFLVNLIVILTIAWRSARARRRAEQTQVHDSGGMTPALTGVIPKGQTLLDPTVKKPNLKKSNLQQQQQQQLVQSCGNSFHNGSLDGLQLNSLMKQANSKHRAKHLKFDLPNIEGANADQAGSTFYMESAAGGVHQHEAGCRQQVCANESVFAGSIEALNMNYQQQVREEQFGDQCCTSGETSKVAGCENEILLNAEPLLNNLYSNQEQASEPAQSVNHLNMGRNPYGLRHLNEPHLHWNVSNESCPASTYQVDQCPVQNHLNHHQYCGANLDASPMISIRSHSPVTTTTTTSANLSANLLHSHPHDHSQHNHQMNRSTIQRPVIPSHKAHQLNRQQQQQQQYPFYLDHSTASPSSSTTLSMTPIQLESLAAITGGVSNGQYQLEPIGMIYQASDLSQLVNSTTQLASNQQEDFLADKMFLISSADSALPVSDPGEMSQSCLRDNHNDINHH